MSRYISHAQKELLSVVRCLKSHDNKYNTKFTKSITDFIDDILSSSKERRNISQNRALKVCIDIRSFYIANGIKLEDDLNNFLTQTQEQLKGDMAEAFIEASIEVRKILYAFPRRRFIDSDVFFIDAGALKQLLTIGERIDSKLEKKSDNRLFSLKHLVKVLNAHEICSKYSVDYLQKFPQITKKDSVAKYLEEEYRVWVNSTIKEHKEYIEIHKPDDITVKRMQYELEAKLAKAKDEHEYITDNFDNLDVKIIAYAKAEMYPSISITTESETNRAHLRNSVPNALWFSPSAARANKSADTFIKEAKNPYGSVYYIE